MPASVRPIRIKRAYEPADASDGRRVLVERLWPRGVTRERAHLDDWIKEVAPSPELRVWFGHDPARFDAFAERYRDELARHEEQVSALLALARSAPLTLVYGARDEEHNGAVVLRDYLERRRTRARKAAPRRPSARKH